MRNGEERRSIRDSRDTDLDLRGDWTPGRGRRIWVKSVLGDVLCEVPEMVRMDRGESL